MFVDQLNNAMTGRILLVLLTIVSARSAEAKFSPLSLSSLVGGADLVIVGRISEVRADTFMAQVLIVVAGDFQKRQIEVRRFRDWTCGRRWAKYAAGQQVILFLTGDVSAGEHVWRIMGSGGEGEMSIEGTDVFPRVPVSAAWSSKRNEAYYGPRVQRVMLETLVAVIHDHRKCFEFTTQGGRWGAVGLEITCDEKQLDQVRNRSELHTFLVNETLKRSEAFLKRWESEWLAGKEALGEGDFVSAEQHLESATVFAASIGEEDPRYADTFEDYIDVLRRLGRDAEAEELESRIKTLKDKRRWGQAP